MAISENKEEMIPVKKAKRDMKWLAFICVCAGMAIVNGLNALKPDSTDEELDDIKSTLDGGVTVETYQELQNKFSEIKGTRGNQEKTIEDALESYREGMSGMPSLSVTGRSQSSSLAPAPSN